MKFYSYHGVMPEEREIGGWFTVSVKMKLNNCEAVESDSIYDAADYSEVYETIAKEMKDPSDLIEHVAGRIAEAIFDDFSLVDSVTVTVQKDNPPIVGAVMDGASVTITANRE